MPDRLWRKRRADGQPTGSWYGAYFDAEGKRRQVCTRQLDRQAARRVLREIERQAAAPRSSAADATLTVWVNNVTDQIYAFNFGNPFSGTHFGAGRRAGVSLRLGFQRAR